MNYIRRRFLEWAEGSPQMDERAYRAVHKEFNVFLYWSGLFLDFRPKHRFLSILLVSTVTIIMTLYAVVSLVTCVLQRNDFNSAALTGEVFMLMLLALGILVVFNMSRQELINFFLIMSIGYYNYEDNEEIPEFAEEMNKIRKQKLFIMILVPSYMSCCAVIALLGRTMDTYAGVASNSSYINDVYMLTPIPVWYPFKVTNTFGHYIALFSQMAASGVVAVVYVGLMYCLIISLQNIILQLKILVLRIKKIDQFAYKLHRKCGGKELSETEMFADADYRQCYNKCLDKCAAHHVAIIKGFGHFYNSCAWIFFMAVLSMTILIALSLLLFLLGGKPSVLSLGLILMLAEIFDTAVVCWQGERILSLAGSIQTELYNTNWFLLDKKANRTMMIMIERCKQPLYLRAAVGDTPVTWETFGMLMNSSYSYVNLLIAMRE